MGFNINREVNLSATGMIQIWFIRIKNQLKNDKTSHNY